MIHVAAFSGGKDSTALCLWLKEHGIEFTAVFCDTGWEHPLTYAYVEEINRIVLEGGLIVLRSEKFPGGMRELVEHKGRVPSPTMRFCADFLKVRPMIAWLRTLDDDVTVYQGIRADESSARATLPKRAWSDDYDAWIERPLLHWTAEQCFDLIRSAGLEPNPLYRMGAGRVGCFPCVMVGHRELERMTRTMPDVWDRIEELERISGRTFFYPKFIPARFHTGRDEQSGMTFATAADVRRYLLGAGETQLAIFEAAPQRCMSVYNLCE